jgi:2-amino-4-hydroxy-6-hydroxymethyldihydropteridine diphosphokinase
MSRLSDAGIPEWAVMTKKRVAHVLRVAKLMTQWADALDLKRSEARLWRDAGLWHDALRDAPPKRLGTPQRDPTLPPAAWHGPAAAERLALLGEQRSELLEAITWHTVGSADWGAAGRALYCADYLEPGRTFARAERKKLASGFARNPDGVLREVVRMRIENALSARKGIHARTTELWNAIR